DVCFPDGQESAKRADLRRRRLCSAGRSRRGRDTPLSKSAGLPARRRELRGVGEVAPATRDVLVQFRSREDTATRLFGGACGLVLPLALQLRRVGTLDGSAGHGGIPGQLFRDSPKSGPKNRSIELLADRFFAIDFPGCDTVAVSLLSLLRNQHAVSPVVGGLFRGAQKSEQNFHLDRPVSADYCLNSNSVCRSRAGGRAGDVGVDVVSAQGRGREGAA